MRALDALFSYDDQPLTLQTDKCLEFLKRGVPGLLKRYGIDHIATHNGGGANIVERFDHTLKTRICRYLLKYETRRHS